MTNEEIARVAHEINRAYCQALGDHSQPVWEDAPEWQRTSAITGVQFHLEHPDADPKASHEKWMEGKRAEGWKWGPIKNPAIKEHPCFQSYEYLPVEQKVKDYLFRAVIHALRPQGGV